MGFQLLGECRERPSWADKKSKPQVWHRLWQFPQPLCLVGFQTELCTSTCLHTTSPNHTNDQSW